MDGTVVSDTSTHDRQSTASSGGILSWFNSFPGVAPAPAQVDQGAPPVSRPYRPVVPWVEDESHPLGELSFETADEGDDVSGVTNV